MWSMVLSLLTSLLSGGATGFIQGGGFGLGYGLGVRMGYNDLYPLAKSLYESTKGSSNQFVSMFGDAVNMGAGR